MSTCAVTNSINCTSSVVVNDFDMFFTHFHPSELMMGNLNDQNPRLKFGHFWNMNIIQRFVSYAWHQHKMLFKVFCKFQKLFKTKVDANSLFLRSLLFHWATTVRTHMAQTHLRVNCKKMWHSVTVTPHWFTISWVIYSRAQLHYILQAASPETWLTLQIS
jgi:hypothetical protein